MSNPTRYQQWRTPILDGEVGYAPAPEPDPDPEDPTDYASQDEGGAIQVGIDVGSVALVQEATHHTNSPGGNATATFGATPTQGSMLFAALFVRSTGTVAVIHAATNPGWTLHPGTPTSSAAFDGGRFYLWYKTAGSSEPTAIRVDATNAMDLWIGEYSGLSGSTDDYDHLSNVAATTNMVTASITPTSGSGLLLAGFVQAARNASLALDATYTEQMDVDVDASGPSGVFGDKIVNPFTGSYSTSATSSLSKGYGWFIGAFPEASSGVVWFPAPAANDGDTATSEFSNSTPECLRVALAVDRLIYRMDLDIGQETAGACAYELYGTDDASFASSTLLATISFTATGSFTLDSVTVSWVPTASYGYYELRNVSGGGSDREFYEVRMYSAVSTGVGVTSHPLLTGRSDDDQHPASAVTVEDSAGWFADDTVETVLAEMAAKAIGYQAHGNTGTTETFDAAIGWHSATLNNNCTFTLTGAPSGTVSSLFLELTQDGTGGWAITLPSSVANKTDLESAQDTTADEVTFLVLLSRDGGTTWYGTWWGAAAGSGGGVDVEDEGTPLATTATTLNFTGTGVTASGTGATKTINIPGSGGSVGAYDINEYTGGDISLTSTTPAAVTGPTDLVVAASTGDLLFVGIGAVPVTTTAQSMGFDFASMVSGSPVNYLSSRTGTPVTIGCSAWFIGSAQISGAGGVVPYVVQSGDISGGNVTLRLYYRVSGTRSINADAATPLVTWVKNMLQ